MTDRSASAGRSRTGPAEDDRAVLLEGIDTHAIFRVDDAGTITAWPDSARNLYGHDAAAIRGQPLETLFADEGENAADGSVDDILEAAKADPTEVEGRHERAGGSVFWATLTLSPIRDDGELAGYAAVSRDTTSTKEYERKLERQNDRLKEFTDILAHDLRNPMTVIDQRLALYRETGDETHLQSIDDTVDRMERLVDDLLRVARQGGIVENPEPTDVESVVDTAWESVLHDSDATLTYDGLPRVSADPDRLCQLFENLIRNAVDHGGDAVTVRVGPLDDGFFVEDDGPGISPSMRDEVFDHGVSTRDEGNGFGLSVVRTIADAHGWDVRVVDAPTGGARIEIGSVEFARAAEASYD